MLEKLLTLREKVINDYNNARYRIVSDFKSEIAIAKDYDSRQLLEMLQNADDANSTNVLIDWDTKNQVLRICNKGNEFSFEGFESLMISNYTSKTSGVFIGNKGLGFRSLLNWANEIFVYSSGCKVSFSKERAEKVLIDEIKATEEEILELNKRGGFSTSTKPFPIMAAPEIDSYKLAGEWTTIIEIKYYLEEDSIDIQIKQLTEEILLFLNNIESIEVKKNNESLYSYKSRKQTFLNFSIINIGKKQWKVFGIEDNLPDMLQDKSKSYKQKYSVKIAFQDDLSDNFKQLFNYFPTKVKVHLPCILHGTFELNNSRDYLNESNVNKFIIKECAKLFNKAVEHLKLKATNWYPYKLITPTKTESDSSIIPILYTELKQYVETKEVFPCIDGLYKVKSEVYYYGNEFNEFVLENFQVDFPNFVIPGDGINQYQLIDIKVLKSIIDKIGISEISINVRAKLIYHLSRIIILYGRDFSCYFNLLTNNSGGTIPSEDIAFTPSINEETTFDVPHKYVNIDVINTDLYNELNNFFKDNYKKGESEARELQRNIKTVTNTQPYDVSSVIIKVITSFRHYINNEENIFEKKIALKQMVKTLFAIYKNVDRKIDVLNHPIELLNCNGEFANASDLYLSLSYSSEKMITYCYDGILDENHYLEIFSYWGLEEEDKLFSENFFKWLGVNSYLKLEKINLVHKGEHLPYYDLIEEEQGLSTDFNVGRISQSTQVTKIADLEKLCKSISCEKLLILAYFEPRIKRQILENAEDIEWSFSKSNRIIKTTISFVNYQFINSRIFENILLQSFSYDVNRFVNNGLIDYETIMKFGIEKQEIDKLLSKLGAKANFNELSIARVFEIIKAMPKVDENSDGSGTSTLYVNILDNLTNQDSELNLDNSKGSLLFFGKTGKEKGYYSNDELNYISNPIFSNQILQNIPLVNLPKRINEKNILKYFGIKSLKESDISIDFSSLQINFLNKDFNKLFEKYKPYLLLYRLFSENLRKPINEESQRIIESNLIKNLNINLVTKLAYKFKKEEYSLSTYDFIAHGNDFYINIPNTIVRHEDIFNDSLICDSIAEILCVQFKINELNSDFRFVVKNDLQDTKHITSKEFSDYNKDVISNLMGVSKQMLLFWNRIFEIEKHTIKDLIFKSENELQSKIKEILLLDIDFINVDYDKFSDEQSFHLIRELNSKLGINVKDIRDDGLFEWHINKLKNVYNDNEIYLNSAIWRSHSLNKSIQKDYIRNIHEIKENVKSKLDVHFLNDETLKYNLYPKYEDILFSIVEVYLEISLIKEDCIEPEILYRELLSKYNIDLNDLEGNIQGLLYFPDNETQIEKYFKSLIVMHENPETEDEWNDSNDFEIIHDFSIKVPVFSRNGSSGSKSSWNSSKSDNDRNRIIGKKAERIAYKALRKKYGKENVLWLSSNSDTPHRSDTFHYDIKYKNEFGEWKKLEVKNYNGRYFKISKDELNLGLSNPNEFEIGLVENKKLFIAKNLFAFKNNDNLNNNSKFLIESNNYTIHYSLTHD